MTTLIRREFEVRASIEAAWGHLARMSDWPSWAGHVERIDLEPPGDIPLPLKISHEAANSLGGLPNHQLKLVANRTSGS